MVPRCAVRTTPQRPVRARRSYRALGPGASCPAPLVRAARRRLIHVNTGSHLLAHSMLGEGYACLRNCSTSRGLIHRLSIRGPKKKDSRSATTTASGLLVEGAAVIRCDRRLSRAVASWAEVSSLRYWPSEPTLSWPKTPSLGGFLCEQATTVLLLASTSNMDRRGHRSGAFGRADCASFGGALWGTKSAREAQTRHIKLIMPSVRIVFFGTTARLR